MNKEEKRNYRLMFLAILSQLMIDEIEDGIGLFKMKQKQSAKRFKDDLLAIMDNDFHNPIVVQQLLDIGTWISELYQINYKLGKLDKATQDDFEKDWKELLDKYKLETK